jgi:phage baseplate assembly protein gpV
MHQGSRRFALLVVVALAALGAAASVALGASKLVITVIKGATGEGGGAYLVSGSKLLPNNGVITAPSTFKCNSANLIVKATSIKLTGGKINYKGPAYVNKFQKPKVLGTLTWKGTPTKGTIRFQAKQRVVIKPPKVTIVNKPCDTGVQQYVPG